MNSNIEFEENRLSVVNLKDFESIKFDDELPMGFTIQLLTDDVLQQNPQVDPSKRSIKVCDYLLLFFFCMKKTF
jgi:hypothetical protein